MSHSHATTPPLIAGERLTREEFLRRWEAMPELTFVLDPPRLLWRELVRGKYRHIEPDSRGILRSRVFPGLWLDGNAVLAGHGAAVIKTLQEGLASAEHAEFVKDLTRRAQH